MTLSSGYTHFAEALVFVHGCKAGDEAAMQAVLCEKLGHMRAADRWRKVQSVLRKKWQPANLSASQILHSR